MGRLSAHQEGEYMTEVAEAKDRVVERPDGALALIRAIESWGATHVVWLPTTESPRCIRC